ncbi:hypothetical protein UFOVP1516_31 [uncultured Caudovirales phage]|uniref:Uncharacterized protein n=1 Tax=uncultured Caudovirales phage TaxID=2100421 RepID=A0A6J7X804_9CAUD|nr:hypothetical protein UFOVP887_13 [uncultured Caudovirales phage]CAB5226808.1 hypothetical protein UFOVP1516_31 [uncultured Caudovirales phage]
MPQIEVVVAGVDMLVEFDYSPFVAGKYSGPWDGSYPDEPEEIDIIALFHGKDEQGEPVDILDIINDKTIEDIERQISDSYNCGLDY